MVTLALEFSSPLRSAAVLRWDAAGGRAEVLGRAEADGLKGLKPMALIEAVLDRAGLEREAVEEIVVGLGPGSYTGIRSAIAVAQGWQLARGIALAGGNAMECLAEQAHARGWRGSVRVLIDAQRGDVFAANYQVDAAGWNLEAPPRLMSLAALKAEAGSVENLILAGPEVDRWFPEGRLIRPDAAVLGRLYGGGGAAVAGEGLEPVSLRETTFVKAPPLRAGFQEAE